jgi:hypothetical protein
MNKPHKFEHIRWVFRIKNVAKHVSDIIAVPIDVLGVTIRLGNAAKIRD